MRVKLRNAVRCAMSRGKDEDAFVNFSVETKPPVDHTKRTVRSHNIKDIPCGASGIDKGDYLGIRLRTEVVRRSCHLAQ
jgi:hypothetical protein